MTAFASVLRKEAREHRLVLAVLAALTVAISFAPFLADVPGVRDSGLPCLIAAFGVLAVSLTVAPSLIPSEVGEGLRFLGRLPVRPRTVFLAKLSFLMIAAAAVGALGYGAAFLTRGVVAAADPSLRLKWLDLALMASPLVAGLWLIAITCLIPRPLAAIPAAAVVFVVTGAPMWWALRAPVQPSPSAVGALAALAVLAPLAAAWLGSGACWPAEPGRDGPRCSSPARCRASYCPRGAGAPGSAGGTRTSIQRTRRRSSTGRSCQSTGAAPTSTCGATAATRLNTRSWSIFARAR